MGFFGSYGTARDTFDTLGDQAGTRARQELADKQAAEKRLAEMRQVETMRNLPPPTDEMPAPAGQYTPPVPVPAYTPSRQAFDPAARTKRETGNAGKTALPQDRSIEISEASNRLQAKNRADTPAMKDRRALLTGPAVLADVFQAPAAAVLNLGSAAIMGARNTGNRVVNAIAGRNVLDTNGQAPQWSLTPFTDEYIRKPVQGMTNDANSLRALQEADKERIAVTQGAAPATAQGAATPSTAAGQANAPLSVRNNNPGNLKYAGQPGAKPGPLLPDGTRFAVFDTPEAGAAANLNQLRIYGQRGINTVEAIINQWSPPNAQGNTPESTRNYILRVAKQLGVDPRQPLDMNNPQVLQALLGAQAPVEAGGNWSQYYAGNTAAPTAGAAQPAPAQTAAQVPGQPAAPAGQAAYTGPRYTDEQVGQMLQQTYQQGAWKLQQLQKLAQASIDPVQLASIQEQYAGVQSTLREAKLYEAYSRGQLSADQYRMLSMQEQQRAATEAAEWRKARIKAESEAYVESVKGSEARATEEMKGNQAVYKAIQDRQLAADDVQGVTVDRNSGRVIVHTKRGVFEATTPDLGNGVKGQPRLVPFVQ